MSLTKSKHVSLLLECYYVEQVRLGTLVEVLVKVPAKLIYSYRRCAGGRHTTSFIACSSKFPSRLVTKKQSSTINRQSSAFHSRRIADWPNFKSDTDCAALLATPAPTDYPLSFLAGSVAARCAASHGVALQLAHAVHLTIYYLEIRSKLDLPRLERLQVTSCTPMARLCLLELLGFADLIINLSFQGCQNKTVHSQEQLVRCRAMSFLLFHFSLARGSQKMLFQEIPSPLSSLLMFVAAGSSRSGRGPVFPAAPCPEGSLAENPPHRR